METLLTLVVVSVILGTWFFISVPRIRDEAETAARTSMAGEIDDYKRARDSAYDANRRLCTKVNETERTLKEVQETNEILHRQLQLLTYIIQQKEYTDATESTVPQGQEEAIPD